MKRIPKLFWPNALTLLNLTLGLGAIMIVATPNARTNLLFLASFFIGLAALMDRFDGQLARKLDAESELGKELDSLSDLVSFGIAPMVVAWRTGLMMLGFVGLLVCILYPLCGAYRLARFNITKLKGTYMGLPITLAGSFMALINILNVYIISRGFLSIFNAIITAVFAIILSLLMISKFQLKKI